MNGRPSLKSGGDWTDALRAKLGRDAAELPSVRLSTADLGQLGDLARDAGLTRAQRLVLNAVLRGWTADPDTLGPRLHISPHVVAAALDELRRLELIAD